MKDIAARLRGWQAEGKRFALATLIKVERSAPRAVGAAMAICEDGTVVGSVSGGCVESALHDEAQSVLETGQPKLVTYGIADEEGFNIGLACGGTLHVFVDRPELPAGWLDAIGGSGPVALATVTSGAKAGTRFVVDPAAPADTPVERDSRELLARQQSALKSYPESDVFIQTFTPPAEMYIFGAADFSAALASMGKFLGFHVSVIDPRAVFATKERFPSADEVIIAWPDAFLRQAPVGESTAICVLTHDPKFDLPALRQAVQTSAGYIGAMGAKKTNEQRFRRLREEGCTDEQLARIHAPIGYDLGGKSPQETAVAIAAEIIALRYGKK